MRVAEHSNPHPTCRDLFKRNGEEDEFVCMYLCTNSKHIRKERSKESFTRGPQKGPWLFGGRLPSFYGSRASLCPARLLSNCSQGWNTLPDQRNAFFSPFLLFWRKKETRNLQKARSPLSVRIRRVQCLWTRPGCHRIPLNSRPHQNSPSCSAAFLSPTRSFAVSHSFAKEKKESEQTYFAVL